VLEVLILGDLLSALLILMDFKSCIISDLRKKEGFMEVLIPEGLGRAMFANCSASAIRLRRGYGGLRSAVLHGGQARPAYASRLRREAGFGPPRRAGAACVGGENSGGAGNSCAGGRAGMVVRDSQDRLSWMITACQEVSMS